MSISGDYFKGGLRHGFVVLLLLVWVTVELRAEKRKSDHLCVVCDKPPISSEKVWSFAYTNLICDACYKLPERCTVCGLPVKIGFTKTSDGRFYCRRDLVGRIFGDYEAGRVFITATDELRRIARGEMELPSHEVSVKVFDVDYWNDKKATNSHNALHKVGFSHSRKVGKRFAHGVVLLSGQTMQTVSSVCAHEYTHLWINENVPAGREIDPDVVEAICELAAWKLMQSRQAKGEMESIRTSTYTGGRIADLLKLEAENGFGEILRWVRTGKDKVPPALLTKDAFDAPPPKPSAAPLWVAAPTGDGKLELQGLVGQSSKKSAVINGVVFFVGDERSVPVGGDKVKLRCLGISENAVVVSTNDTDRTELFLKVRP